MWRCQVSGALNTPKATATRAGTGQRCQIVLPDQAGWWCVVDVETIGPCPRPGIVTDIFGFEDLLHGRHDLVDGVPGCVRRIGIAPGLDRLDFRQLLRQRFFRRKNVVDFLISFPCNAGQPAPQIVDGVSGGISGLLTPELRATIEAVLAKLAAPGACNPDDQTPVVDDTPDADAVRRDTRSQAQRHHDGLLAGLRGLLASGELGQHRGLPVTVVVSTTLKELEAATGKGVTGGGSRVPMSDLIRMASNAHHYLALFDGAKPLALYHTKRLASPAQRIMLYAKDRGCSRPGCDAPAYHSEVHHVTPWTTTHRTDINDLTLACGPDNRLVEKGWKTRKNAKGDTEWLPPAHLDHGQPRINRYHHPEKILCEPDDDEPH